MERRIEFKLDNRTGFISDNCRREYILDKCNINENLATRNDLKWLTQCASNNISGKCIRFGWRLLFYYKRYVFNERVYHQYDVNIERVHGRVYLDGYWQIEKYCSIIRNVLLKELTVRTALHGMNKEYADKVGNSGF
jgi:hypothetical protein